MNVIDVIEKKRIPIHYSFVFCSHSCYIILKIILLAAEWALLTHFHRIWHKKKYAKQHKISNIEQNIYRTWHRIWQIKFSIIYIRSRNNWTCKSNVNIQMIPAIVCLLNDNTLMMENNNYHYNNNNNNNKCQREEWNTAYLIWFTFFGWRLASFYIDA